MGHRNRLSQRYETSRTVPVSVVRSHHIVTALTDMLKVS